MPDDRAFRVAAVPQPGMALKYIPGRWISGPPQRPQGGCRIQGKERQPEAHCVLRAVPGFVANQRGRCSHVRVLLPEKDDIADGIGSGDWQPRTVSDRE